MNSRSRRLSIGGLLLLAGFFFLLRQPSSSAVLYTGVAVVESGPLTLEVVVDPPIARPGDTLRLTARVSNRGGGALSPSVALRLPRGLGGDVFALPAGATFNLQENRIDWLPVVAAGQTQEFSLDFIEELINFAHGEVLALGTYGGWFALMYVTDLGGGVFEAGAATIATVLMPLFIAILFLPLETLAARRGGGKTAGPETSSTWLMTLFSLPIRLIVGGLIGYGLVLALGAYAPHIHLVLITVIALLFVVAVGMITSMLTAITLCLKRSRSAR